jgi:16S rRNA (guanine527-N7)-methyltransferase
LPGLITKYFTALSEKQIQQFERLQEAYAGWNERINVISRKDIGQLEERHVLHSLGIAKVTQFEKGARVLDVGTGGGFPGIPLAIMFPETEFTLIDSIGKKIKVVQAVADALELKNVKASWGRAEDVKERFHFVVSRAVTEFPVFYSWVRGRFLSEKKGSFENGIFYLKGGDLNEELKGFEGKYKLFQLKDFFSEEFFDTKKVVYLKVSSKS